MFAIYLVILFVGGWVWFLSTRPNQEAVIFAIIITAAMMYATANNF
jgi:hypothetical protein